MNFMLSEHSKFVFNYILRAHRAKSIIENSNELCIKQLEQYIDEILNYILYLYLTYKVFKIKYVEMRSAYDVSKRGIGNLEATYDEVVRIENLYIELKQDLDEMIVQIFDKL